MLTNGPGGNKAYTQSVSTLVSRVSPHSEERDGRRWGSVN